MSSIDKLLSTLGLKVEYIQDDDVEAQDEQESPRAHDIQPRETKRSKREKTVASESYEPAKAVPSVTMLRPRIIADAQQICDEIKSGKTVIVNVEDLTKEEIVRLYDFVSGVRYALEAKTMDITENVFIVAPSNVGISVAEPPKEDSDYLDDDVFEGNDSEDDDF